MTLWAGETWMCECGYVNAVLRKRCRGCGSDAPAASDIPAAPKVCGACGVYEGVLLSEGSGWVCADADACVRRCREQHRQSLLRAADILLHPDGRCTCGGEGRCQWCMSHCIYCGSSTWPHLEDEAVDYEALGYPETGFGTVFELDHVVNVIMPIINWPSCLVEKDIRTSTDNG